MSGLNRPLRRITFQGLQARQPATIQHTGPLATLIISIAYFTVSIRPLGRGAGQPPLSESSTGARQAGEDNVLLQPHAMNRAYLFLYRSYMTVKTSVVEPILQRWPGARTGFEAAKAFLRRHAFRSRAVWLQVQSGFAKGMWMHLRIPEEAGFWRGEHEPDVQKALASLVREGDVVYDIGAHLGSLALGMARLAGLSGRVVAFEGDADNVARLRDNVQRNQLELQLGVVHAAVWSHSAPDGISFRRGRGESAQGGVEAEGERPVLADGEMVRVPVVTLDEFVAAGHPAPNVVKIDVEGGEYRVLRGGATVFAEHRPYIIAEVHNERAAHPIRRWLEEFRYRGEWKIPKEEFPRCLIAWPAEKSSPIDSE